LRQNAPGIPRRSYLPGHQLLDMHVDASAFWELCERDLPFAAAAKQLAVSLHEDWLSTLSPEQLQTNPKAKPWSDVDPDTRNANLAQASRIPNILALVGLRAAPGEPLSEDEEAATRRTLGEHAEILAEAEHNHWMVERLLSGWRYARRRDDARKLHPLLIPYHQLVRVEQEKDLAVVRGRKSEKIAPEIPDYINRLKRIGFRIERIPPAVDQVTEPRDGRGAR
jgi:hypothetical protein